MQLLQALILINKPPIGGLFGGKMSNHSEQINELAAALAKAQAEFRGAEEDKVNPHFKSKYSSLNSLWAACREGLSKNGLSVVQTLDGDERLNLTTTLMHSSGQWIKSVLPVVYQRVAPQVLGSAITYAKRYALSAIVGISSGDDDDGNSAQEQAKRSPPPPTRPTAQTEKPQGFDAFCAKIGLTDQNDPDMCRFVDEICKKSNKTITALICDAIAHKEKFFSTFDAWKKNNQ